MKIFIRFDKLENYSCDGTAFVSFVLRLRLPRNFFMRLGKLRNLFCLRIFYYLQPLPVFSFCYCANRKEKSLRVKTKK